MARIKKIQNIDLTKIINGCKKQEANAQELLFERYARLIYTICRRYDSPNYPAKDLLQDTFIKAFDRIHQYDIQRGKLVTWIGRIAINLALNAIRDNKFNFVNIEVVHISESSDIQPLYDLSEEEILQKINELPLGYKTVFNLHVIDDFSHKEIAEKLGISVSTSKSQLHKAKKMLQTNIVEHQKKNYG